MPVKKLWYRSYEFDGRYKNPIVTNTYVLKCNRCGQTISVTYKKPIDLELETGWRILDNDECYCKECR